MKKQHLFRITVEHIASPDAELNPPPRLQFEAGNHDDIMAMVARAKDRTGFDDDTSAAFAIGLKLFGEVMLTHRSDPLFSDLAPHFADFMRRLKQRP